VVGSVVSVVCGALALYLFVHRGGSSLAVSLLDTAALAILFSASGAALASRRCLVDSADTFRGRTGRGGHRHVRGRSRLRRGAD
jgi:hypothetical protein